MNGFSRVFVGFFFRKCKKLFFPFRIFFLSIFFGLRIFNFCVSFLKMDFFYDKLNFRQNRISEFNRLLSSFSTAGEVFFFCFSLLENAANTCSSLRSFKFNWKLTKRNLRSSAKLNARKQQKKTFYQNKICKMKLFLLFSSFFLL